MATTADLNIAALAAAPNGSSSMRPVVVLLGPREATSGEKQIQDGLKLAA